MTMKLLLAAAYLSSPLLLGGCIVEDHDRGVREHDHGYEHEHEHEMREHDHDDRDHDRDWPR